MINLEVEGYCQSCLDFCPDVIRPERVYIGESEMQVGDTIVRCKYRKRCAGIKRYLEKQLKEYEAVG